MCPSTTVYPSPCASERAQSVRNNAHQVQARFDIANVMKVLPFPRFDDGFVMTVGKMEINEKKRGVRSWPVGRVHSNWSATLPFGNPDMGIRTTRM